MFRTKVVAGILLAVCLQHTEAFGQKIYAAEGYAKVRVEEHLSLDETRDLAREQAKLDAIESIFGTQLTKEGYVDVADGDPNVILKSMSSLKGEWLKTTNEVFTEESRKIRDEYGRRTEIWIICQVEGKVREITQPVIPYEFRTLNCPDLRCETTDFKNGESMYLHFESPIDGYLSVYLVDTENAYRILPYQQMPSDYLNHLPVSADRDYMFFTVGKSYDYFEGFPYYLIDEIYLDTDREQEFFKLYVVFSKEPFDKPILDDEVEVAGEYTTPKTLSKRNFEVWVQDNRIFDTEFYFKTLNVRVRR